MSLNKSALALSLAVFALPLTVMAQDSGATADPAQQTSEAAEVPAAAGEEPASSLTWNLSVTSDYVFRGITQTDFKPAVQGGLDYAFGDSGFYAGVWASNVDFADPDGPDIELDTYVGYSTDLGDDWNVDFSVVHYAYSGERNAYGNLDYNEFFARTTYREMLTFTLAYANDYANLDYSSLYFSVAGSYDLGNDFSLNAGVGHSKFSGGNGSYSDWNIGVSRQFGPVNAAINYYDTSISGGRTSDTIVVTFALGS